MKKRIVCVIWGEWERMKTFEEFFSYAFAQFLTIGPVDFIDIALVAVIIFFVIKFISDKRAAKLALGICMMLFLLIVSQIFKMSATNFLFSNITQVGIILIVVVFQPELRSALEKIGGSTFEGLQSINHSADKTDATSAHGVIEAVSRSAQDLSEINYGALIVIERDVSLDEYKESGAYLDSVVTADALNSIFYKGAALHDGAVIIRDGRIDHARCVLPMTSRIDIPSELGTRHRAALGLSEKTDAVVVVVSEETGTISISIDGELERGYTYATLRTRLDEILNPIKPETKKEKKRKRKKSPAVVIKSVNESKADQPKENNSDENKDNA